LDRCYLFLFIDFVRCYIPNLDCVHSLGVLLSFLCIPLYYAVLLCLVFSFFSCSAPRPGSGIYGLLFSFGCGFVRLSAFHFLFLIYHLDFALRDDVLIPVAGGRPECGSIEEE